MYDNKTKLKVVWNAEANRLLKNTQNSRCMYKECCNKPIDSHCYQKSMLEEKLSDKEGMVYCWSIKGVSQQIRNGKESFFGKEHINKASVFKGFCKENHDTPLFRLIEVKDYVEKASLEEYSFLYAYRNLCHLLWEEKAILADTNDNFDKPYDNPVIKDIKPLIKSGLDEKSKELSRGFDFGKHVNLKNLFEKFIVEDGTVKPEFSKEFKIFTYQINKALFFASMACKELGESKYPISFGILPEFQNKPNIFYIIAHEEDSNVFSRLVEFSKNSGLFIQNIVLKSTSNTILHPKLYNKLCSTGEIKNLYNFISYDKPLNYNDYFGFNFFDV